LVVQDFVGSIVKLHDYPQQLFFVLCGGEVKIGGSALLSNGTVSLSSSLATERS
jgi:hypothetical protein